MSPAFVNDSPEVSVILPTYNRAAYLPAAVESVLSQSFRSLELIVVDDGSTDETLHVIKQFSDERLIYLRQENRGRSFARNRAIGQARGRFIAFLDSDDEYLPGKLKLQVAFMREHPDVGMLYTSAVCIDKDGNPIPYAYSASVGGSIYCDVAFFVPVTVTLPTVIVRKEVLDVTGAFDLNMSRFEDTDLWRRIAKRYRVGALDIPTCRLRTHDDNALVAQDPKGIVEAIDYYVRKIFAEDSDVGSAFLKQGAARLYAYYGRALVRVRGRRSYGLRLLGKAFVLSPTSMPAIFLGWVKAWIRSRHI
jgi:glycosyltransferase involved in cell wall biosynthesis